MARRPPSSKVSRLARLGSLTSKVSTSYLSQRIAGAFQGDAQREASLRQTHLRNAERVVSTMGTLKGAAMKVGQQLAQVVDGMELPDEVADVLGRLNDRAEPVPFDAIRSAVEAELEGALEAVRRVRRGAPRHRLAGPGPAARLPTGERVVVKVLHHGIEQSVDSDLAALKTMLVTGRVLRRDRAEIDAIFDEIRDRLTEELDYYTEAANIEYFRKALVGVEGVEVPGTHPAYSTGRVLTMDRLTGAPIDQFLERADDETRLRAGERLVRVFYEMAWAAHPARRPPRGQLPVPPGRDGGPPRLRAQALRSLPDGPLLQHGPRHPRRRARAFFRWSAEVGVLQTDDPDARAVLWEISQVVTKLLMVPHYRCGGRRRDPEVQRLAPCTCATAASARPGSWSSSTGPWRHLRHAPEAEPRGQLPRAGAALLEHAVGVAEGRVAEAARSCGPRAPCRGAPGATP